MVLEENETPGEEESHHKMLHRAPQVPEQALQGNILEIFEAIGMRISLKSKQNWN